MPDKPHADSDAHDDSEHDRDESETGNDGGSAPVPFAPDKDDDSPLGDTDQHSDA